MHLDTSIPRQKKPSDGRYVSIVIPVYRDADRAISLIDSLKQQHIRSPDIFEILVIDDGSGDDTATRIEAAAGQHARIFGFDTNRGRSVARNTAARHAKGDILMFIDCDCLPAGDSFISQHLATWEGGTVASIGPVLGNGRGFWNRYQSDASARRAEQHRAGSNYSGSSQNLMVARWAFDQCGGFDEEYRAYGFEDRDLQIRLLRLGSIAWSPNAAVRHMDAISLHSASRKLLEAGELSSTRFSMEHRNAYRMLGYASIDVREQTWLGVVAKLADKLHDPLARLGDCFLDRAWIPYLFKKYYVRTVSALSFMVGTSRAASHGTDKTS